MRERSVNGVKDGFFIAIWVLKTIGKGAKRVTLDLLDDCLMSDF